MIRIGYKLFRYSKGNLFPLYVLANKPIPLGVWLEAEAGERNEKGKVKSRLGALAYRPGWHINDDAPYVEHIYTMHDGKKCQKDGTVWAEVEYHTDRCYNPEAREAGWRGGKWSASRAQLDYIPVGGYYKYRTNPQMKGFWVIAGEMKVNRILTDDEVRELCRACGYEPLERKVIRMTTKEEWLKLIKENKELLEKAKEEVKK